MDIFKIYKAFFTFWILIFAIMYLTRCKSSPNSTHENSAIETKTTITSNAPTVNDSLIHENEFGKPATTAVDPIQKPVRLIYLK